MTASGTESRHIGIHIDRPAREVYDYASDPSHLPEWAAGLGSSIERTDGQWAADSPMGRILIDFAPRNDYGVLDHDVTLPTGETVHNPLRVIADTDGCEVVFTLRRRPDTGADEFRRDAEAVSADLATLKRLMERA
ncbi:SRPBCC family protein [Streptomyces pratensis]|uniref:SRPBCC family protein n=1 Tax=Streptomyces pratensis TaxID=1169025 RepID=UPI001932DBD2|nr:SRPBCC family protein [Streptomyces pratensis]